MTSLSRLLLPPASEGAICLDHREKLVAPDLSQRQFRGKEPSATVEHFQVTCGSTLVPYIRQPLCALRRTREQLLLLAKFTRLPVRDQRVGDFAEGELDRLAIPQDGFLAASCGQRDVRREFSSRKQRLRQRGTDREETCRSAKQARQRGALKSANSREADLRKVRRLGDTNISRVVETLASV